MSFTRSKVKTLAIIVCVYILSVVVYGVWSYNSGKKTLLKTLDDKLLYVASNIKRILPEDFHDRAVDKDSISKEEDLKIGSKLSAYVNKTGIIYAYTIIKKDDKIKRFHRIFIRFFIFKKIISYISTGNLFRGITGRSEIDFIIFFYYRISVNYPGLIYIS